MQQAEKDFIDKLKNVPDPHIRDLNKTPMLSYRAKLSELYDNIRDNVARIAICLDIARQYPAGVFKEEAVEVEVFLKDIEVLIEANFELFINMSDE